MSRQGRVRWVVLRDLMIFQTKLAIDGLKDVVLSPLALAAAALDLLLPGGPPGWRFYAVMSMGERFDRWLSLFAAAQKANGTEDGLFGASRSGSSTLLGRLEELVIGVEEPLTVDVSGRAPTG